MRLTRAYLAGLGTTGSLLAAAVCAVVFTSAVVAFKGRLPTPSNGPTSGSISVAGPSVAFDRAGTQIVALRAAGAAVAVAPTRVILAAASAPTGGPTSGAGGPPVSRSTLVPVGPVPVVALAVPHPSAASASATPSSPPSGPSSVVVSSGNGSPVLGTRNTLAGTVDQTTATVGGIVQSTTGTVGPVVGQVSPPVGQAVPTTGQTVGGVLGDLGHALGVALRAGGG